MFRNYVRSMVLGVPFQPMFDADGGQGGAGGGTDPGDDDPDNNGDGDNPDGKDKDKDEPVTFDERQQAEIEKIKARIIAKERKKAEDARKEAERKAKLSADEKAEEERKEREQKAQEREQKANERLINMEIRDVARDHGVSAKKLERFLKVVDREELEVDEDGNIDRSKVESTVKATLADMPEFKGADSNKGPGDDFKGGQGSGAKYSLAQIQSMSPKEVADNYDDVMKSYAIHNKK